MSETRGAKVDVTTPDGVMDAYVAHPSNAKTADETWRGVVLYIDGLGPRDTIHRMADRLAASGYFVIVPNMYWRSGPYAPFDADKVFSGPGPEMDRVVALIGAVTPETVAVDARACFDLFAKNARVRGSTYGLTGYCLGGGLALRTAVLLPDAVACAASFHGGNFVVDPTAPALLAAHAKCPIYIGVAGIDRRHTPEVSAQLDDALRKASVPHEIELYEGKGHGWCVPDLPTFDAEGAERHWKKLLAFFETNLP